MNTSQLLYSIKPLTIALLVSMFLAGCIRTTVKDFTDPDFSQQRFGRILLMTPSDEFDRLLLNEIQSNRIAADVYLYSQIFMPTREYSGQQIRDTLLANNIESVLMITISGTDHNSRTAAIYSTANTATYNTGYGSTSNTTISSMPIVISNRNTLSQAELYETSQMRKVWVANLNTKAEGSFYTGLEKAYRDIARQVVGTLLKRGHLGRQQTVK